MNLNVSPAGHSDQFHDREWIALDCRLSRHSGIGAYIRNIFPHLPSVPGHPYLTIANPGLPAVGAFPVLAIRSRPLGVSNELLAWQLRRADVALLHIPHINVPWAWSGRLVVTIHDLIPATMPSTVGSPLKRLAFWTWARRAARKADAIVTVSEYSRQDILRLLFVPPERVTVIPDAVPSTFRPSSDQRETEALRHQLNVDRFLLYVGRPKLHKNLNRLVRAFRIVAAREQTSLVLIGLKGLPPSLQREANRLGIMKSLRCLGYVDEEELPLYYQAAVAVVLPSLYEGFGLPALEGMACGTPVIAANRTSLPEVVGDAGLLVDPEDEDEIAGAMLKVAADDSLRQKLAERGLARAAAFSPRKSAAALTAVYRKVLGQTQGRDPA